MQVEALYEDGKLHFGRVLKFRHQSFRVVVDVPEDEILNEERDLLNNLPIEVRQRAKEMRSQLDQVRTQPQLSDDEIPPLSKKVPERIDAFEQREEP